MITNNSHNAIFRVPELKKWVRVPETNVGYPTTRDTRPSPIAELLTFPNSLVIQKYIWKYHTESTFRNLDTLPHKQSIRCAAKIIEHLALDNILK